MQESVSMQTRQRTLSASAVIFAVIVAPAVSEVLRTIDQPWWSHTLICGLVAGVVAAGFFCIAKCIRQK